MATRHEIVVYKHLGPALCASPPTEESDMGWCAFDESVPVESPIPEVFVAQDGSWLLQPEELPPCDIHPTERVRDELPHPEAETPKDLSASLEVARAQMPSPERVPHYLRRAQVALYERVGDLYPLTAGVLLRQNV